MPVRLRGRGVDGLALGVGFCTGIGFVSGDHLGLQALVLAFVAALGALRLGVGFGDAGKKRHSAKN